jgi:hypothetical protein
VKYEDGYRHFGCYLVAEKHRNLGYGGKLFEVFIADSSPIENMSAYSVPEMVKKYQSRYGAIPRWTVEGSDVNIPEALDALRAYSPSAECKVMNLDQIDMQRVYNYDTEVFGYNRVKFLEKWFNTPGTHTRVAVNKEGSIVGYVAVRLAFVRDEGYKIAPLFCENIEVGKALLKGVLEDVHKHGLSSSNSVMIHSPTGRNAEAKKLLQLLNGTPSTPLQFVSTNGLPRGRFDQWFGITSLECG